MGLMNVLKYHWCETSLLSQAVLKHVVSKDFIFKKSAQSILYPAKNDDIINFSCHITLLLKRKLQHVGHKWVLSRLFCGSVGQMGQQV